MDDTGAGRGIRTCRHSGCSWPAVASLGFDYDARWAWVDDLHGSEETTWYDLCSIHADRFRAPVGWRSEDRRRLAVPLFEAPELLEEPIPRGVRILR